MKKKPVDRRTFSRTILKTVLGSACLPLLLELKADAQEDARSLLIDMQDPAYAALNQIGGGVKVQVDWQYDPVIITRVAQTTFAAFTSTCTHFGCEVGLPNDEGFLDCPCHGARFNLQGQPVDGPAEDDLPRVPFQIVQPTAIGRRSWGQVKRGEG